MARLTGLTRLTMAIPPLLALTLWASIPTFAHAGRAHQHGVAAADIAVDAGSLVIAIDVPLDDLVGFERAPRTDAERARVAQALATLRDAAALIRPDPAAGCNAGAAEIVSPALGLGAAQKPQADGHADLQATWTFGCRAGARPAWVELRFLEAFPRLQRIDVQSVTPAGQHKATLRRPASRVTLGR